MRIKRQLMVGLVALSAVSSSSSFSTAGRGTLNSDGTCSGYPEEPCQRSFLAQVKGGDPTACLAINGIRSADFPSQIQLASNKTSGLAAILARNGPLRIDFKIRNSWITAGLWAREGELLLVDSGRGELMRLTASGQLIPVSLGTQSLTVSDIRPTADGMLLKLRDGRFVALDGQGRFQRFLEPLTLGGERAGVRGIFNWAPLGGSLLAFGDILTSTSNWKSGWMQVSLGDPGSYAMLMSATLGSFERGIYLLGNSYVTTDGSAGYVLIPGQPQPQLFRIFQTSGGFKQQRLQGFELTNKPGDSLFPAAATKETLVARYRALERSNMAVGLYAQGENLYLLMRRPYRLSGQTEWELSRLDKGSGRILKKITLPTWANHLVVIPGNDSWAFVEKGSVQGFGQQDLQGLLLVPTSWLEQNERGGGTVASR